MILIVLNFLYLEEEEIKFDNQNILLLNKQDFENIERMKNYNIFNSRHTFDEIQIDEN